MQTRGMLTIKVQTERNGLETVSGIISCVSCKKTIIPFTFDKLSNIIEAIRPASISEDEMTFLGKIIHQRLNGWKKIKNFQYKQNEVKEDERQS